MANRFEERYKSGDMPWDIQRPDYNLVNTVKNFNIKPCKALDIGCGLGDNAIWLYQQGFKVAGIDFVEAAIAEAMRRAEKMKSQVPFYVLDFLTDKVPGNPYSFVFDRGCFHSFDSDEERSTYAGNVHRLLEDKGLWLTLSGNYDDGRLDVGPPKRKASQIIEAVEPWFRIRSLVSGKFDSNDPVPSMIWICLMEKRKI
jgi:SAM-dependent methyltransferase